MSPARNLISSSWVASLSSGCGSASRFDACTRAGVRSDTALGLIYLLCMQSNLLTLLCLEPGLSNEARSEVEYGKAGKGAEPSESPEEEEEVTDSAQLNVESLSDKPRRYIESR